MTVRRYAAVLLGSVLLAACATKRPSVPPPATATAGTLSAAQLLAAVQQDADAIDQAPDGAARTQHIADATANAQQCLVRFPDAAACPYAQAQALGLTAREHPTEAISLLKQMLASLARAESLDPALDHAGAARLSAIVLLRAPPWPLGPGDVDSAVTAAQRAVTRDGTYPPNLITLGVAQGKSSGSAAARITLGKAQDAINAWPDQTDRAKWQTQLAQALHELP